MAATLVFDIETVPDVAGYRTLNDIDPELSDAEVAELAFQRRRATNGTDFLPLHLQRVVAIACVLREGAGFKVVDLGVQIAPETFVEAIREHEPDVVGFSAFLTTTMPMFKVNIAAIEQAGLRDDVIVLVGGAPVTQEYADAIGADGYAPDAASATKLAKELQDARRALATA